MCQIYTRDKSEPLEKKLKDFVERHEFVLTNETDIIAVCKKLDISAIYITLDEAAFDGFILVNNKDRVIAINRDLAPLDARFLIAHELGHYITEAEGKASSQVFLATKDKLFHGKNKPPHEHDMDYLAAAILVPKDLFKWELDKLDIHYAGLHTEEEVKNNIPLPIIKYFAQRYRVRDRLIIRRIAEVSYYV